MSRKLIQDEGLFLLLLSLLKLIYNISTDTKKYPKKPHTWGQQITAVSQAEDWTSQQYARRTNDLPA